MPFQIFPGRTGHNRLIVVEPSENDRASVILVDGTEIAVVPSMTKVNGYPGIKPVMETLPEEICEQYRHGIHFGEQQIRQSFAKERWSTDVDSEKYIKEAVDILESQPLICANIAVGRELLLVLSSGYFPERNRFRLSQVKELIVP